MSRKRVALYDPETKTMTWGWKDEGPSYARASGTSGELVVGISERMQAKLTKQKFEAKRKDAA